MFALLIGGTATGLATLTMRRNPGTRRIGIWGPLVMGALALLITIAGLIVPGVIDHA